jgi:hypothetical protein
MKHKVIKDRKSDYPNPIELKKNEIVIAGEEYSENENWANWIECTNKKNISGWVPKQILKTEKNSAIVLEDYSANELNIKTDEEVKVIKILNGWAWSKNSNKELGWIPLENIKKIK